MTDDELTENLNSASVSGDPALTQSLDLVRLAQGGNPEALNRLFSRYYERVRRVVRMRLGRKLRSSLESGDILQETFAVAVKGFDRFEMREEASLINWLSKLAERQIIAAADYHGAKKRDRDIEIAMDAPIAGAGSSEFRLEFGANVPGPGELAAADEEALLVELSMEQMSEEYRDLLILRNYVGASWEHIAEAVGSPSPDAARMMHARGMIELGKHLREGGADRG